MQKLNHLWRLIGTALGFFFFGLGGLLLRVVLFPLMRLFTSPERLKVQSRLMIHYSLRAHVWMLCFLGVLELKVHGADKLNRPGQLLLANHPCLLDVVFLLSKIPDTNCIVKHSLWQNPFTRGPVINAGYVSNGDSVSLVNQCVESLQAGENVLIFPEGTRTTPDQSLKFQRGAAQIALRSGVPVVPIVIYGELPAMTKQMKWYQIPERKMNFTLYVGDELDLSAYSEEENISIAVRRLTKSLEHYFSEELERHDGIRKRTEENDCRYA